MFAVNISQLNHMYHCHSALRVRDIGMLGQTVSRGVNSAVSDPEIVITGNCLSLCHEN